MAKKPKPLSKDTVQGIVASAVSDAVDFIQSEIAPDRIKAQKYFDGKVDIGEEEGRSKVVATKARDTVRAIKPSLMRVFLHTDKPVEYTPVGPSDVASAGQATRYAHYKFDALGGFRLLQDAFHDALVKKVGIHKIYWEDYSTPEVFSFTDLPEDLLALVVGDPDVEVLEHALAEPDANGMPLHDVKVRRTRKRGDLCIVSVPPEEFFVDRQARCIDTAYVCGHRTEMRAGDLAAMLGVPLSKVSELGTFKAQGSSDQEEDDERRGFSTSPTEDEDPRDPSMAKVGVTEAYMRVDVDGSGVPVLHRFICGGPGYQILSQEPWDEVPFAIYEVDPEPHAFFGRSIVDIVVDDQDAATAILRGILDNVSMTNNPRLGAVEGQVNMTDLLNNEIGAVVRMRQPGAVQDISIPFVAGQTLPALQYLDSMVETKTGVTRASMGLDPDALQSTTKAAVTATISAAAGQVETIARNLAESGVKRLFKLMLKLICKHQDRETHMQISEGEFVPVDPRVWNVGMDVRCNVGLGTGREEEKAMALSETLQMQQMIYQTFGPQNGLVTMTNIRNTLADLLAARGVRNADRYWQPMDPAKEQQLMQQAAEAAANQPPQPDPNSAIVMAEQIKAQSRDKELAHKSQGRLLEMLMDDDFRRDQMAQDLHLKAADIQARNSAQVDMARIKAEQERRRDTLAAASQPTPGVPA